MKAPIAAVIIAATASVSAQAISPEYTTTVIYEDCSTATDNAVTVTQGVTITTCPLCTETSTPMPTYTSMTHTTVYVTT